jgi:hypothetical protein
MLGKRTCEIEFSDHKQAREYFDLLRTLGVFANEAIREIEKLLETIKEIIFEQDEDDADTRRVILNLFNYLMYLIKEVVDESDNNINICF